MQQDKTGSAREWTLKGFLDKIDARLLWSVDTPIGGKCKMYAVNGRTFIVQVSKFDGFEFYIPACQENDVNLTFEAVEKYLQ